MAGRVERIEWLRPARVDSTVAYQRYYLLGLEATGEVAASGPGFGVPASAQARLLARSWRVRRLAGRSLVQDGGLVGRYLADGDLRIAIDARDSPRIWDADVLEWSDVYFKANAWPDREYAEKVRPVVNGNGLLGPRELAFLRGLRDSEKQVDVVAVVRVWGSAHALRMLEELARLDCSKDLLAIFPAGTDDAQLRDAVARLERAGVPWTTRPVPARELWTRIAAGRTVFARPGKHVCWPWRTLDLLALGACAVYDRSPPPRWPEPLRHGTHYLDCAIDVPDDGAEAASDQYAKVATTFDEALADPARSRAVAAAAAVYFDRHAEPAAVGAYVRSAARPVA